MSKANTMYGAPYYDGIGANAYWFGGGPGMDPYFNGTTGEAWTWGQLQAQYAYLFWQTHSGLANGPGVLFLDVEDLAGIYGWNEQMQNSDCRVVKSTSACCSAALDRATVDGFLQYLWVSTPLWHGVYSSVGEWTNIFGSSTSGDITGVTMAWTADWGPSPYCINPGPYGWTQSNRCGSTVDNTAGWFGGLSGGQYCALMWQWYGSNTDDYDQVNSNNLQLCP